MASSSYAKIRGQIPYGTSIVLGALPIVTILLLWWVFTLGAPEERRIGPTILPSPVEVVKSIPELVSSKDLLHHIWASVRRVGLGYALALIVVLPLGILMGAFSSVGATFTPFATASAYIP